MGKPKRIQRKRTKGFRMPARTLCVSRPSIWGNCYPLSEFGELSLPLFRSTVRGVWNPGLLAGKPGWFISRAYELHRAWGARFQGHPLEVLRATLREYDFIACWCPEGQKCHADILLELANGER